MSKLWKYAGTPGKTVPIAAQWPADTHLPRVPGHYTLVMAAHPQCPCTRASLSELARIMARSSVPVTTYVCLYKPRDAAANWAKTDLYDRAAAIPGVMVITDEDATEARRFHATISGQTLLYDPAGHLLFSGGITAARGHEGDNAGQEALIALLTHQQARQQHTPVFGCSLLNEFPR
jgi:hypothetical protein